MDHFTIVTDRPQATLDFYALLGLHEGPRPDFPVPGHWLYVDERPFLHVVNVRQMPEPRRGALDHMAYWAEGFGAVADRLKAHGIPYRVVRAPAPYRTWQLFFDDPNGVEVELDFDPSEPPPSDWKTVTGPKPR
jgi:catechol 2,3-dioxygenase-like lactoylglutathione lyase family enzyme